MENFGQTKLIEFCDGLCRLTFVYVFRFTDTALQHLFYIYHCIMVKKLLLVAAAAFLLFWVGTLILIPNPLAISAITKIQSPISTVDNFATNATNWHRWWPGTYQNNIYTYHSKQYRVGYTKAFGARVLVWEATDSFITELNVLPAADTSIGVVWTTSLQASLNPFTRIQQYNRAVAIKKDLQTLLDSLAAFGGSLQRFYGIDIQAVRFTNPYMITTIDAFTHYPTVDEMYKTVQVLRDYAREKLTPVADSPMINIERTVKNGFWLRAALPVTSELPEHASIRFTKMVLGNTLVATVTGGRFRVEEAMAQMQQYISDKQLTVPAIPFQLLITNRQQQPDTSKWTTKLYYPVY